MRQLVLRFYEQLWNHWDDSVVAEVLAPGFRFRGSLGQQTIDREGWRAYRDQIRRGAPDFHNDVVDLIISDDRAAARLSYTGTTSVYWSASPPPDVLSPIPERPSSQQPKACSCRHGCSEISRGYARS